MNEKITTFEQLQDALTGNEYAALLREARGYYQTDTITTLEYNGGVFTVRRETSDSFHEPNGEKLGALLAMLEGRQWEPAARFSVSVRTQKQYEIDIQESNGEFEAVKGEEIPNYSSCRRCPQRVTMQAPEV